MYIWLLVTSPIVIVLDVVGWSVYLEELYRGGYVLLIHHDIGQLLALTGSNYLYSFFSFDL